VNGFRFGGRGAQLAKRRESCGSGRPEIYDDTCGHTTMLQPVEDLVDCRERLQLDIGLDLALGGKGERLGHILAVADKRVHRLPTVAKKLRE